MYNKGLSLIYMGSVQEGLQDLEEASQDKAIDDHKVIDEAIRDRGEGYMVFSVVRLHPSSILYHLLMVLQACWRSLSPLREETEECSCQELPGRAGRS
jgi:hypothetical protein